jgi:hypothetical protein
VKHDMHAIIRYCAHSRASVLAARLKREMADSLETDVTSALPAWIELMPTPIVIDHLQRAFAAAEAKL